MLRVLCAPVCSTASACGRGPDRSPEPEAGSSPKSGHEPTYVDVALTGAHLGPPARESRSEGSDWSAANRECAEHPARPSSVCVPWPPESPLHLRSTVRADSDGAFARTT